MSDPCPVSLSQVRSEAFKRHRLHLPVGGSQPITPHRIGSDGCEVGARGVSGSGVGERSPRKPRLSAIGCGIARGPLLLGSTFMTAGRGRTGERAGRSGRAGLCRSAGRVYAHSDLWIVLAVLTVPCVLLTVIDAVVLAWLITRRRRDQVAPVGVPKLRAPVSELGTPSRSS